MVARLRHFIAWPGAVLGLALLGSGLFIGDTAQWRLHLLAGLWLLSLPPRALWAARTPVVTRGLARLSLVLALGFGAVALQLARNQITRADEIREQALAILQPTAPATAVAISPPVIRPADRKTLGSGRVWPIEVYADQRGTIFDRYGNTLAATQKGRRSYPNPNLGHLVGLESRLYGNSGLEGTFESYLSGERSLAAASLLEARLLDIPVQSSAADLYLTLDSRLQEVAQNALGQRKGAVVLLDPRSGAILAMVSYPRFDPNQLVLPDPATEADVAAVQQRWDALAAQEDSPLINRATQGRYPPGSIIKTLTAAAALDSGALEFPESPITCPNRLYTEVGAPPVRNAVEGLSGLTGDPSDLRRAYSWSCNTAFAQIGLLLGTERFSDYAQRFGLGFADQTDRTADLRDIPTDAGTIANSADFLQRPAALADTAFGQGQILATPLDMAQMVALIANNGQLMRPYLVQEARAADQILYSAQAEVVRQVISPASAERMRAIMKSSVDNGYASPVAIPGVDIGAKTGTAEVPGGYPHSWFVAIAPLNEPRFAIAVIVENGGEGSVSALPVARQVLTAALQ